LSRLLAKVESISIVLVEQFSGAAAEERSVRGVLAWLMVAALIVLLWQCACADGAVVHQYLSRLSGFATPDGLAVDSNSNVYIADREQKVVWRYGVGGVPEPFTASAPYVEGAKLIGTPTGPGGSLVLFGEPAGVAVRATSEVYVADFELRVVDLFASTGEYSSQLAGTPTGVGGSLVPFERVEGLAVNQETGDLYVADPEAGAVDVFDEAGNFIRKIEGLSGDESIAVNELSENLNLFAGERVRLTGGLVVSVFNSSGARVKEWTGASTPVGSFGRNEVHVAVDHTSGHVFVADNADDVVDELASSSGEEEYVGRLTGTPTGPGGSLVPFENPLAVAVDPVNEDVYVADRRNRGVVDIFGPDVVAPNVKTEAATEVEATSALLNGEVSTIGEGAASCRFVWGTSEALGHSVSCEQSSVEGEEQPVSLRLDNLEPDTTYFYRLQATNHNGTNEGAESPLQSFTTPGPGLVSESVSDIASTSATLDATLNPDGAPTSYFFQYGPTAGYGQQAPVEPEGIGSEGVPVAVSQHVDGLSAGSVYHYRVVAVSELSVKGETKDVSFFGADQTLKTQSASTFSLLDGREWELVSQPALGGALVEPAGAEPGVTQAAASGDAFTYLTNIPTEDGVAGYANKQQVLSVRGPGGWVSHDLAVAHEGGTEGVGASVSSGQEYRFFDQELSLGIIQPFGPFIPDRSPHALAPTEASEQTAFLSNLQTGAFTPLVAGCPAAGSPCAPGVREDADVPAGTEFGKLGEEEENGGGHRPCPPSKLCGPLFVGATSNAGFAVLQNGGSEGQLTKTPLPPEGERGRAEVLYEWAAARAPGERLALVSVLPEGRSSGGFLGTSHNEDARNAISDDGSRVFWTATNGHLYMRDLAHGHTVVGGEALAGETVQLDAVQPGASGEGVSSPVFQDASPDGSRVFFTDEQQLTENASRKGADLYECEIVEGNAGKLECRLRDVTPEGASEESAEVQGVLGLSDEGDECDLGSTSECDLYFVANGALAAGAVLGNCEPNITTGLCNLYVDRDGTIGLVAVLSGDDASDWARTEPKLDFMSSRVSGDGRWVAFMSDRDLTGFDPDDAVSGHADEEAYLFDAVSGRLVCASCDPSGARPVGVEWDHANGIPIFSGTGEGGFAFVASDWVSGLLPAWEAFEEDVARYQTRYLSNEGRLFFDSVDALVPQDINGTWDVYEYEPVGVGPVEDPCGPGVASGGVVFRPARAFVVEERGGEEGAGCVGLISKGTSPQESAFMDASESGGDVFLLTTSRLVPQAIENTYAVYDAHECSVGSPCLSGSAGSSFECGSVEQCRAAPVPVPSGVYGAPSSATFTGVGNVPASGGVAAVKGVVAKPAPSRAQRLAVALKACRRMRVKKRRVACEKQARRAYGAHPASGKKAVAKKTLGRGRGGSAGGGRGR
jgi:hypothetical protein